MISRDGRGAQPQATGFIRRRHGSVDRDWNGGKEANARSLGVLSAPTQPPGLDAPPPRLAVWNSNRRPIGAPLANIHGAPLNTVSSMHKDFLKAEHVVSRALPSRLAPRLPALTGNILTQFAGSARQPGLFLCFRE